MVGPGPSMSVSILIGLLQSHDFNIGGIFTAAAVLKKIPKQSMERWIQNQRLATEFCRSKNGKTTFCART